MLLLRWIIWGALLLAGVVFTALNAVTIELHYYAGSVKVFLPLLIFLAFFFGMVTACIAFFPKWWHGRRNIIKLKREIKKLKPVEHS